MDLVEKEKVWVFDELRVRGLSAFHVCMYTLSRLIGYSKLAKSLDKIRVLVKI